MCTGMRWAKRTQVKIGLTVARPLLPGMTLDTTMPRATLSTCPFNTSLSPSSQIFAGSPS